MSASIETTRALPSTPAAAWIPAAGARRIVAGLALSAAFAALTVAGANIVIPLEPVPVTMQTLFVLLAGASIGAGWGTASQWMYVGLGAMGLPLFAGGASGAGVLAGPTGGYLISFLVAIGAPGVVAAQESDRKLSVQVRDAQGHGVPSVMVRFVT